MRASERHDVVAVGEQRTQARVPLVLVEERDARRFDLIADAVRLRAVVACALNRRPRLLEEGVISARRVGERSDPLRSGTVEDDNGFVTTVSQLLRSDKRVDDAPRL